jgi:hypothetical protein
MRLLIACQSARVGARPSGRLASSFATSASVRPSFWPINANDRRRKSARAKRRWLPAVRTAFTRPRAS